MKKNQKQKQKNNETSIIVINEYSGTKTLEEIFEEIIINSFRKEYANALLYGINQ